MKGILILIHLVVLISCIPPVSGQDVNSSLNAAVDFDSSINDIMEELDIPGLSIAVSRNGSLLYGKGFGYADVKNKLKANDETLFRMASVSKLLAAAAVAKLMEEGKLDINAPIEKYIEDYPHADKGVTTKLLLSHQAGIRHYNNGDVFNNLKNYKTTDQALKIFIKDPLVFEPGTSYKYSTFAFTLIQALVEAASGMDYLDYLQSEIFSPIGMDRTFPDKKKAKYENHSKLYRKKKRGEMDESIYDNPSYKWGGGGMLSNALDLVEFGEAHLSAGFFSKATLDSIFTPITKIPGGIDPIEIGMAWRISKDSNGDMIYHHAGNMNGARSVVLVSPNDGTVVAIMSNNRQLDFIENFALSLRDHFIDESTMKLNSNYLIYDKETNQEKGRIKIMDKSPYFPSEIVLEDLFPIPLQLNLVSSNTVNGIVLKNLNVSSHLLYASLSFIKNENEGNLTVYHKNDDDSWSKKDFLLRI